MDSQRTGNGFGPNPIGFEALNAWRQLRGIHLLQWQIDILINMDLKRREVLSKKDGDEGEPVISEQPLTSDLFDALFPE